MLRSPFFHVTSEGASQQALWSSVANTFLSIQRNIADDTVFNALVVEPLLEDIRASEAQHLASLLFILSHMIIFAEDASLSVGVCEKVLLSWVEVVTESTLESKEVVHENYLRTWARITSQEKLHPEIVCLFTKIDAVLWMVRLFLTPVTPSGLKDLCGSVLTGLCVQQHRLQETSASLGIEILRIASAELTQRQVLWNLNELQGAVTQYVALQLGVITLIPKNNQWFWCPLTQTLCEAMTWIHNAAEMLSGYASSSTVSPALSGYVQTLSIMLLKLQKTEFWTEILCFLWIRCTRNITRASMLLYQWIGNALLKRSPLPLNDQAREITGIKDSSVATWGDLWWHHYLIIVRDSSAEEMVAQSADIWLREFPNARGLSPKALFHSLNPLWLQRFWVVYGKQFVHGLVEAGYSDAHTVSVAVAATLSVHVPKNATEDWVDCNELLALALLCLTPNRSLVLKATGVTLLLNVLSKDKVASTLNVSILTNQLHTLIPELLKVSPYC